MYIELYTRSSEGYANSDLLSFCGVISCSSRVILGNIVNKVNEDVKFV